MSQKVEQPTLQGQRFRTGKTCLNELNDGKLDCDGLIKCLLTNGTFDFRVYGEVLFDIIIAGGILAPGGSIVIDSDASKQSKTDVCLSNTVDHDDLLAIKSFANIFVRLIQRFGHLEKTLACDNCAYDDAIELLTQCQDTVRPSDSTETLFALNAGAAILQLFIVENFTGPICQEGRDDWTHGLALDKCKTLIDRQHLSIDSVEVHHQTRDLWLLYIAGELLQRSARLAKLSRTFEQQASIWLARYYTVYLSVLLDPVESLMTKLKLIHEKLINDSSNVALLIEISQASLLRGDLIISRKSLEQASTTSGIQVEATGVLGKRTKFQEKFVPQLVINVIGEKSVELVISPADNNLPEEVHLDCDTLLPEPQLSNGDNDPGKLSQDAQLILLATLNLAVKSEAVDEAIAVEFSSAYLRTAIRTSTLWSVKYKALILRCQNEAKTSRKSERALLQMESLERLATVTTTPPMLRLCDFYSVLPPTIWSVQRTYGNMCMSLGLFKNALEIFIRIEDWDNMINCYKVLEMNDKAQQVIRQQLAKEETPYLYCLLGDIHESIEYYEKSWKLSNSRYARAQKCLGTYHYVRKDYLKACEHYELALRVNPSNLDVLKMISYSYLTLENYEKSAHYYRAITGIDDACFLVWNNLSKAYIKSGQKKRAYYTLSEAIRCNYDEWKIWENFMLVSLDVGAFSDVIKAWHRLIDLKQKHNDDEVLERLADVIEQNLPDMNERPSSHCIQSSMQLFDRMRSTSSPSPKSFMCNVRIILAHLKQLDTSSQEELAKYCNKASDALSRSVPGRKNDPNWFKESQLIINMLQDYLKLLNVCHKAAEIVALRRYPQFNLQLQKIRLNITSSMSLLDQHAPIEPEIELSQSNWRVISQLRKDIQANIESMMEKFR